MSSTLFFYWNLPQKFCYEKVYKKVTDTMMSSHGEVWTTEVTQVMTDTDETVLLMMNVQLGNSQMAIQLQT